MSNIKGEPQCILSFEFIPPTIKEANIMLSCFAGRSPQLSYMIKGIDERHLIQELFGISEKQYEDTVSWSALYGGAQVEGEPGSLCEGATLICGITGPYFYGNVPWEEDGALTITHDDLDDVLAKGILPGRKIDDLHPVIFDQIIECCEEAGEDWMAEEGYPAWFDLISLIPSEVLNICNALTKVCCGSFKDLIKMGGYSQVAFSRRFHIGKRTVDEWASGKNSCKIYLRLMFAELMGIYTRRIK